MLSGALRILLLVASLGSGSALAQSLSMPEASGELPAGEGRELVAVACTQCHTLTPLVSLRDGPVGWQRHVNNMVLRGAHLNGEQMETVVAYLNANFGMGRPLPATKPVSLPEGQGKPLVEARCALCHGLDRVTAANRNERAWRAIVRDMFARYAFEPPDDEEARIVSYLARHFGPNAP